MSAGDRRTRDERRAARRFALLLRLFPAEFRERFGDEMEEVFRAERREVGPRGAGLWWRTVWGVLRAAPRQHLDALHHDVRYALRTMRRRPLFTAAATLSLAVGIAATTTVVAVWEAAFVRPLPGITRPDELVDVKTKAAFEETFGLISYPDYRDLRERTAGTLELVGFTGLPASLALEEGAEAERVALQVVTPNYFQVLGAAPLAGRTFDAEDERRARRVVVISEWLWRQRLGASSDAIGCELLLNGTRFTVVGVAPQGFRGHFIGFNFDVFTPTANGTIAGLPARSDRRAQWVELFGRLAADVPVEQAAAGMTLEAERLEDEHPETHEALEIRVEPRTGIDADLRGGLRVFLLTLGAVALLVLSIACGNVASMMVARVQARRREMALRRALGAGRARLARQSLTESVLLALLAGAAGLLLAVGSTRWAAAQLDAFGPVVALDARIGALSAALAFVLAVLSTLLFGLLPAARASRDDLITTLRQGDAHAGSTRLRAALVVAQVGLSLVVLVSAGLFVRALAQSTRFETGFDPSGVWAGDLAPVQMGMSRDASRDFLLELLAAAREVPAGEGVALTSNVPLGLGARFFPNPVTLGVPGYEPPPERDGFAVEHAAVSDGYFATLDVSIVAGRPFRAADGAGARLVAVVNETFARRFFVDAGETGADSGSVAAAVGRTVTLGNADVAIVGVAADGKYRTPDEGTRAFVWLPFAQHPRSRAVLLGRAAPGAGDYPRRLRDALRARAPYLPIGDFGPLERRLALAFLPQRVAGTVVGGLGLVGLFLTAVGLYGVIAYGVGRREREIGVRMSLGARPADVMWRVVRGAVGLVLLGLALGLPLTALATGAFRGFLLGVHPLDVPTYVTICVLLLSTAVAASWLPARRAARVDPVTVLRAE